MSTYGLGMPIYLTDILLYNISNDKSSFTVDIEKVPTEEVQEPVVDSKEPVIDTKEPVFPTQVPQINAYPGVAPVRLIVFFRTYPLSTQSCNCFYLDPASPNVPAPEVFQSWRL